MAFISCRFPFEGGPRWTLDSRVIKLFRGFHYARGKAVHVTDLVVSSVLTLWVTTYSTCQIRCVVGPQDLSQSCRVRSKKNNRHICVEPPLPFSCRHIHTGPVNCRAFNLDFFKACTSGSSHSLDFESHLFCLWRLDKKNKGGETG